MSLLPSLVPVGDERCEDCGAADPRIRLGDAALCDRCADRRVSKITGYPELPDPPPPFRLVGPDGRTHDFTFRIWRAPTGVEVSLEESGLPTGEGYRFAVLGAHDAEPGALVAHVRRRAEEEVGRQYLQRSSHRTGWTASGDEVVGRLVWSEKGERGASYDAVVDGRTLSWEELGQALEPFEGWQFRLVIEDVCEDLRPDAEVVQLRPGEHP
jgi:hypothetical protein